MSSEVLPTSPLEEKRTLKIGSRKSKLAIIQTNLVIEELEKAWPQCQFEIVSIDTSGDKQQAVSLHKLASDKNLWTADLEALLLEGKLDFLVHSLKDVPTRLPEAFVLSTVPRREDPRDCLVIKKSLVGKYKDFADLPNDAVVGTSSLRRQAQILNKHPSLKVSDVRGNIATRLSKLDAEDSEYSALVLAVAGIVRLGLSDRITSYLDPNKEDWLYAVGQGGLGIEFRVQDDAVRTILDVVGDLDATLACTAERALLRHLEGGCSAPLGVHTSWNDTAGMRSMTLKAAIISPDGSKRIETDRTAVVQNPAEATSFGKEVAVDLLEKGASEILEAVKAGTAIQKT